MEHVDHILGGDITRGARCVRTATQSGDGRVNGVNAMLECDQDIAQRLAVCVVAVHGQLIGVKACEQDTQKTFHAPCVADANGVA